jgi:DNA adenine methylase
MGVLIKWSGSKASQCDRIISYFPKYISNYIEPFVGGGSVFLKLLESDIKIDNYIISDLNKELIGIYNLIKNDPNYLISHYTNYHTEFNNGDIQHRKDVFNEIRKRFNTDKNPADFYCLTRTSTNGLVRYSSKGVYNVSPHFSRPGMKPDEVSKLILHYSKLFNDKNVMFNACSYEYIGNEFDKNALIYCDSPYTKTKGMYFNNFDNNKYIDWCDNLSVKCILSYDAETNGVEPNFINHIILESGNSSFRRTFGKTNDTIVQESLYLNF